MDGLTHTNGFISNPDGLHHYLKQHVSWDERMTSRKTASFGAAYNYSQMSYPFQVMLPLLEGICKDLKSVLGFEPNNCLINYYVNGKSKMGFHADQTDILEKDTGIAIVSLGAIRTLRFRNINEQNTMLDFELLPGSLLYMTQTIQQEWEHAILKSPTDEARMSLTFRRIIV